MKLEIFSEVLLIKLNFCDLNSQKRHKLKLYYYIFINNLNLFKEIWTRNKIINNNKKKVVTY